jgi:predicted O-methyltransferase YrrM
MTAAERLARRVVHWMIAARDTQRLYRRFPALRDMARDLIAAQRELAPSYHAYVHDDVWMKDQAISPALASTLLVLCGRLRPMSILDLGSGYSSYVFRLYASRSSPKPEVWSVDDNASWLERTRGVLSGYGLDPGTMVTWQEFDPRRQFDLVLHDLGNTDVRKATVDRVCRLVTPDGVIVLDDAHHYRSILLGAVRRAGLDAFSLRRFTLDGMSRYAFLATPAGHHVER